MSEWGVETIDLVVTIRTSVVHEPYCPSVARARVMTWDEVNRFSHDTACKHCLPRGLPKVRVRW